MQKDKLTISSSDKEEQDLLIKKQRPFFLSILCVAVFVYSGLFTLLFLTGIIFNKWLTTILNDFLPERNFNSTLILLLNLSGVILYGLSFLGAFYIWKLKLHGFYIYMISTIILIIAPYFIGLGSTINTIVFLLLILLPGMYYRKLH
ncbi:MAG: hypothetical protein H8D45_00655 [Bacteroidetes bacterium]|nr:hypothetical protein [Bacteroidota bacterium]MBL7104515.1 hypothetical protein [Bacteroidales bacterium]